MNFIIILMELFEIKLFTIAITAITNVEPLFTDVAKIFDFCMIQFVKGSIFL